MTQEEKQLLLKDLCARLPYKVKVWYPNGSGAISTVKGIVDDICYFNENPICGNFCHIEVVKPYLRSTDEISDEESNEMEYLINRHNIEGFLDFVYSRHIDWRNLIEKGLALEAPEGMYNTKLE